VKSTKKVVSKSVKEVKKGSRRPKTPNYPDLPYKSKNWRAIQKAVQEVIAERKAREGKTK